MGQSPNNRRGIVVVGASAGGVEALQQMVASLPGDLPATLFVVLHLPPHAPSALPRILERVGSLPARHASDGETIEPGTIYIAPPDRHLLVERDRVRVVRGPRENLHRPAIDPLFRSAALTHGSRVVGVVLSGTQDDGAAGLKAITSLGGAGIVQDPGEATFAEMPRNAIRADDPRYVLPVEQIGPKVAELVLEERKEGGPVMGEIESEIRYAMFDQAVIDEGDVPGKVVPLSCPECGGTLWELDDGEAVRFRCRVGHAFGSLSLDEAQEEALETALWAAIRALEERAALSKSLAGRLQGDGLATQRRRYERRAREAEGHATAIRDVLLTVGPPSLEKASG